MPVILGTAGPSRRRLSRAVAATLALIVDLWIWGGGTQTIFGGQVPALLIVGITSTGYACLVIWRSVVPGYVALWLLSLGGLLVPTVDNSAGFLLALYLVARTMSRRAALLALGGAVVPIAVKGVAAAFLHPQSGPLFILTNVGLWALLTISVWVFGRIISGDARRLATERQWAHDARSEAITVERLRLSREIHDIVAHSLTGIILQAAGARSGLARGTASDLDVDRALESIQTAGEQSMRELHRLLGMLRENDRRGVGANGIEQIGELLDVARESGFQVASSSSGTPVELDQSVAHTAYRIVQEGLSNAMKHGGVGARIEVGCDWLPGSVALTIRNTAGPSAQRPPSGGFGLVGLRERVSVCGGTLEAGRTGDGFLLHATLPTNAASSH